MKSFLYLIFVSVMIVSCRPTFEDKVKELRPSDLEYFQRAYPSFTIDPDEVRRVRKQVIKRISTQESYTKNNNPWKPEGPTNIGGRITDIARHPTDSETFYIATCVGGVFKTTDGGRNWIPIFDDVVSMSMGNIAVSQSNPDVMYVGTGEANGSASSGAFVGTGVWRSDDAGNTWQQAGLSQSNHIARLVIDKNDPDVVYAAATGILYGKGNNRGLYKTEDGGASWKQLHFVSDSTACIDVVVHPENDNIIYTAMWERIRYPWIRDYGGPTSGIYRSMDGGDNWERLENGINDDPEQRGRIGLSMSMIDPDILYASFTTDEITNRFSAIYKTSNQGDSWRNVSGDMPSTVFGNFGWFFGNIRVDPNDYNNVYVLGFNAYKSELGGTQWNQLQDMHVDMHALEVFQGDSQDIIIGNDGGVYRSLDGGDSIFFISNIPITQFYNIEVDYQNESRILGGTQDNGTVMRSPISDSYRQILGGDGFHVIVNPKNSQIVYAERQYGILNKSTSGGITMIPAMEGIGDDDRHNWNTPVVLSPIDPSQVYYGSNYLYESTEAIEWQRISDDLTQGQHPSGSVAFGTLTTIAPSYQSTRVVYTGSDDGQIYITRSRGLEWTLINEGLPNRYVTKISLNPNDDAEAIVTFSGYGYRDFEPHIFITYDYGASWASISGNLPDFPINDIEYDPWDTDHLYIGTDYGVWHSTDKGVSWEILGEDLPLTIVKDIKIHQPSRRLYAGTFGRSIHSIDIAESVSTEDIISEDFKVFPNPAEVGLPISLELEIQDGSIISLHSMEGELIQTFNTDEQIIINVARNYVLTVQDRNKRRSAKLLVVE